ncbi:phosphate-binding protein [Corticibacter populi]|uniref:Phosphate-binding protein n=1 Tax=Corticibacter populi TaxID=1550736 RepID=A0A3M6QRK0_9BURK|nr:phosphate-binding protein [Corticibacter populi]RMX05664.1 phosphate-binding protein [Corticibacter populi]RZS31054.1 phosphate ABC transporter substrate-binding protein (PhoT family) [Corticibacter populi]
MSPPISSLPGHCLDDCLDHCPDYRPGDIGPLDERNAALRGGLVPIVGNDGMASVIEPLNALFRAAHPQVGFATTLRGSATAIPALIAGASVLAPMSRDPWTEDRLAFRRARGYEPTPVRLGYTGYGPRDSGRTPPAMYVHASNPLAGLSMAQLRRVYTSGDADGDIVAWGQLGLKGPWAQRRIHLYGLCDTKYARGLRDRHFAGLPYAPHYEPLVNRDEVIRAVAQDPYGIGATGWVRAAAISDQVRILPLAQRADGPFETPDLATIAAGGYPLKAWVSIFLDLAPGQRLAPLLKDYLRLALSRQGQAIIASRTHCDEGYVPLAEADWRRQAAELDRL